MRRPRQGLAQATSGSEVSEKAKDATRSTSPKKAAAAESPAHRPPSVAAETQNPAWLAPTAVDAPARGAGIPRHLSTSPAGTAPPADRRLEPRGRLRRDDGRRRHAHVLEVVDPRWSRSAMGSSPHRVEDPRPGRLNLIHALQRAVLHRFQRTHDGATMKSISTRRGSTPCSSYPSCMLLAGCGKMHADFEIKDVDSMQPVSSTSPFNTYFAESESRTPRRPSATTSNGRDPAGR